MAIRRTVLSAARGLIWIALAWAAALIVTGGFDTRVFGRPFTAHDPFRPLLVAAVALSIFFLAGGDASATRIARAAARACVLYWREACDASEHAARWHLDLVATLAVAAAVVCAGVVFGSKAASGSDAYGYLSQAALWREGRLSVPQPWAAEFPWPNPAFTATPLGYRAAPDHWIVTPPIPHRDRDPWDIVPIYAPGFPLLMAASAAIAGQAAAFWVVPLSAGLLVLATYGIGRRIGSRPAGLIAGWLVATSPPVVGMTMSPLSDVPVAAAWAAAFWGALGTSWVSAAVAGAAAAVAILIRPNFAPLGVVLLAPYLIRGARAMRGADLARVRRREAARAIVCAAGLAAGSVATAATYWAMYGSPFMSGYGGLEAFHRANVPQNLRLYTLWFADAQTPLALAGLVALAVPARRLWPFVASRATVAAFAVFVAGVWVEYLFYGVFESDFYLRFLLASWPFIMLGLGAVLLAATRVGPRDVRAVATMGVAVVVVMLGVRGFNRTERSAALTLRVGESKFVTAAVNVRPATVDNSVVFTMQHSGSVRYYAGRVSLRWDMLDPGWLDRALAWLSARGVHPYALLDSWERDLCEQRFAGEPAAARFRRPPIFTYLDVGFYDLAPDPVDTGPTRIIPESAAELGVVPPAPMATIVLRPPDAGR